MQTGELIVVIQFIFLSRFFFVAFVATRLEVGWSIRKAILLVMSYLFYAAWNPPFVLLLMLSTTYDFFVSKRVERSSNDKLRKLLLLSSLMLNLGVLAFFKYGNFFLENLISLLGLVGYQSVFQPMSVILPVGISFYTFQTLSYTIDVYRKKVKLPPPEEVACFICPERYSVACLLEQT